MSLNSQFAQNLLEQKSRINLQIVGITLTSDVTIATSNA